MPAKAVEQDRALQIAGHKHAATRALIVGRDSLTSGLLADALIRDLKCEAAAIHSSDLLRAMSARKIDLVVISAELNLRPGAGFELACKAFHEHPEIPIIILLDQSTHETVIEAFRSGARGVFNRENPIGEFLDCVEHVRKGFLWTGREEATFLLDAFRNLPAPSALSEASAPILTPRELQVVRCAARGKTNKAIATDLGLSEHTVKNYLFRAFEKLGVSSRVELIFYLAIRGHSFGSAIAEQQEPEEG